MSKNVKVYLETIIFRDFILLFKPFEQSTIDVIRTIKHRAKIENRELVLRRDHRVNNIYLVINGKLQVLNETEMIETE